ncbi:unnamed protein product [Rotaria sp. Silwood2]|nr:unnamed protein product [Rotaria sp. Silwood2]CAF4556571.1 unnamed protein product [Rotaria sp. Silwood2]
MPLNVSPSEKQELLVTFAALVLHDSKLPITSESITKLVTAAGGAVEPYWPKLFASLLEGRDVGALLMTAGGGAAPAGAAPAAAAPAAGGKKEEAKKKKSSSSSAGGDGGFSLFD